MFAAPPVIWFTGLPGSGKTTLAQRMLAELRRRELACDHLDGDEFRNLFPGFGFSREARDQNVRNAAVIARYLQGKGVCAVASFISPYGEARAYARSLCQPFVEVHLSTSLAECERRDPKGLYAKARAGAIASFTGVSDPYEAPETPELRIDTAVTTPDEAVARIFAHLSAYARG
jgi:adenylylsulfate kinase